MATAVSERARLVLAPNPGPMTLEGTNTWLLADPASSRVVVVDPGPDDDAHLDAVSAELAARDQHVAVVVLTHGHPDHSAGARRLAERHGAAVRAVDVRHRLGDEGLVDGEVLAVDGLELRVLATPGHASDHVCLVLDAESTVLTGDHVLGRGTSVVAHPDGHLASYLDSLRRLADVGAKRLLPGHGPVVDDAAEVVARYLAHRADRDRQVVEALRALGAATAREVVECVYVDVDRALWGAAEMSVRAHLERLVDVGAVAALADDRHELVGAAGE